MHDRAMQALYALALAPIAETLADRHSYGFREGRRCADALEQCFTVLSNKTRAQWVLEGDIRACFDEISHDGCSEHVPMDKRMLRAWLKAGYWEKGQLFPTTRRHTARRHHLTTAGQPDVGRHGTGHSQRTKIER